MFMEIQFNGDHYWYHDQDGHYDQEHPMSTGLFFITSLCEVFA